MLYENTAALPRARVVHRYEVIADPAARLRRLVDPHFDHASTIVLEQAFDFGTLPRRPVEAMPGRDSPVGVRIQRYTANEVALAAVLAEEGFVVLSDLHLEGWKATVQGRAWPLLRVDHALRAVPLARGGSPAEPYRIRLRYEPPGFQAGLWWALAAGVVTLFLVLHPWVASRGREPDERGVAP